ncbi:hypothetical protein HEK616_26100 [Streptomyces nigrescens]|uniref:Secreted protein n=2 Tax=Streptomyces TaxID=1883 RepID=A0ABM7ZS95_STRNI|nr:hypothetical protein [Streptomyces nigrescens]MEE4418516.1 hypothetical protein [Streptomyces sp. DSM 41528]BDM69123.1 hypothetical protein HEK616_26100 [Streptomyces nigrescens]
MRDTVSTGRSAATQGRRVLLLLALLALLHAAFAPGSPEAPAGARACAPRATAPVASAPAVRPCAVGAPVLASGDGDPRHPGSGVRHRCEGSVCHLRHHVPTGAAGKALGASPVAAARTAGGVPASGAVHTSSAAAPAGRVTVLRC